ncbi:MAG: hypothetical protein HXS54_01390 [Theionarchaea archaeon]|nr:hypothetical protein [Theionarchaea archaeon]
MSMKVSAGFGLSGALIAMIALFVLGGGVVVALGAVILLSPLTAGVFILIIFMVLSFFLGGERKTLIATICLFLILSILFGKAIQSTFETISPIFIKGIEVIL